MIRLMPGFWTSVKQDCIKMGLDIIIHYITIGKSPLIYLSAVVAARWDSHVYQIEGSSKK